jgi:hypothetical protein
MGNGSAARKSPFPDGADKGVNFNRIRLLVESYYDVQDIRIKASNAIDDYSCRGEISFKEDDKTIKNVVGKLKYKVDKEGKRWASITWMERDPKDEKGEKKMRNKKVEPEAVVSFKGMISKNEAKSMKDWVDERMARMEKELMLLVSPNVYQHKLWQEWLSKIRGIGPCLAGALLSRLDPRRARTPSAFHKICGLHVDPETHLAVRRQKGVKGDWAPFLKKTCWKIGETFVKTGAFYKDLYKKFRAEVDAAPCPWEARGVPHKDRSGKVVPCPKAHRYALAKRKVVKIFLAHLWTVWRKIEGLPTDVPYSFADHPKTGFIAHDKSHYIEPPWEGDVHWPKNPRKKGGKKEKK